AVSTLLEEDGTTGLSTLLQDCFEAFQDLSASPESASARTGVVGQAQSLVSGLQERYQALEDQISAADQNAGNIVQEINTLAQQIAELNRSIPAEGASSDEQDQRQALVNELAGLVDVQVYEDSAGDLQVSLASGSAVLVGGTTAHTLAMAEDGKVTVSTSGGTAIDVTAGITQGSLGANLDLRDNLLLGYQKQLDQLAAGIIDGVNALHREGYALDGTTTGLDFFTGSSVRDMAVNPDLVEDPSLVAAAGTANASGDNTIAKAIAALQEATDTVDTDGDGVGDTGPFSSVLSSLVSEIGLAVQGQETAAATQENLLAALQTQRDSVSGVDLDEEAVKLITCQRAYQASANFISVLDDLMEQLLTQLGS
ncbi:MAG TPA: flagellar hook-associated protein FlgK, partial [Holophaga sp.]|nr:flagellar hook-associated protein FlgK [Holophaga sp.]